MDGTDSSSVCSDDFVSFGFSATNAFSSGVWLSIGLIVILSFSFISDFRYHFFPLKLRFFVRMLWKSR